VSALVLAAALVGLTGGHARAAWQSGEPAPATTGGTEAATDDAADAGAGQSAGDATADPIGGATGGGPVAPQEADTAPTEGVEPGGGPPAERQPAPLPLDDLQPRGVRAGADHRTTEAARAFEAKLHEALKLEAEVQAYEWSTLGMEDPERLHGFRLERRQRLDRDRAAAEQSGRGFAVLALVPPRPAELASAELGRRELTLLTKLGRAYETSRSDPVINHFMAANRRFLESADWSHRDRAVGMRDRIVEREKAYTRLIEEAYELLSGTVDESQLEGMEDLLAEVAPETRDAAPDLSVLVLRDQELRQKVLAELQAMFLDRSGPPPAPPPAARLLPRVMARQRELVERAELNPVIQEHLQVETELGQLETDLEASVDGEDLEARKELLRRKVELTHRRNALGSRWFGTEPDPLLYAELVKDQDALIRRMMLDLSPRGTLYGGRYDAVRDMAANTTESPAQRWTLLQAQEDLIAALTAAKPEPDPLDGMLPLATLVRARPPPMPPPTTGKPGAKTGAKAGAKQPPAWSPAGSQGSPSKAATKPKPKSKSKKPSSSKAAGKPGGKPSGYGKPRD
jgi:hypothetical protein